jgi:hypothetical protein
LWVAALVFVLLQPNFLPEFIRPKDAARDKQAKKHTEEKKHEPEIGADLEGSVVNLVDPDQFAISALL